MEIKGFTVKEKEVTFYPAENGDRPLVVLNTYTGDGGSVMQTLRDMNCEDFNLLTIGDLNWEHDMTPWFCPPLSKNSPPCTGGADEYLGLLLSEILPKAMEIVKGTPSHIGIAGYSLAGLFSLYAMYKCNVFERAASMSGSLWYPEFKEFVLETPMERMPDKLYLSLGDREDKTRHPLLKTVRDNTEAIAGHYRKLDINTAFELNDGNHFKDEALRSAKGIMAII